MALEIMKTALFLFLTVSLGALVLQSGCATQKSAPATAPAAAQAASPAGGTNAPPPAAFTNVEDRAAYAIGMNVGANLKRSNFDVNLDVLMQGMRDEVSGRETKITEQESRAAITEYQRKRMRELAEKNQKEGEAFLAENKMKEGVHVLPVTLANGQMAELQYKVITEGTGALPGSNDTVTVNYRGTLINGKEFDSSMKRGKPAQFPITSVIRGWTEALRIMKVGSKWELYIPPVLAYGESGRPGIEPDSTLIFEVELVGAQTPEPPKPITSDIIRVPSADEIKAGAQVEVIKAEDAEKRAAGQTSTNKN